MNTNEKNNAIWEWLKTCEYLKDMFFNFGEDKNNNTIIASNVSEANIKEFVDGSKKKVYQFTVIQFKKTSIIPNSKQNINTLVDVTSVMEWIEAQDKIRNYPNFGSLCLIESVKNLQNIPNVAGQDKQGAKYMFAVEVTYLERKE